MSNWSENTSYSVGDTVSSREQVRTKWNRFMFWAFNKPIPTKKVIYVAVGINTSKSAIFNSVMEVDE